MKLFRVVVMLVLISLSFQNCDYSTTIAFQIVNDLSDSVEVKIYGISKPINYSVDTILVLPSKSRGIFSITSSGQSLKDNLVEYNGRINIFDSLIVFRKKDKSNKRFDKKTDWQYIENGQSEARHLLTIDESDF